MQNSLSRLLEGIAESLGESVLPAVSDPYAQGQVKAAIEILANLATRVQWDRAQIDELIEVIGSALDEAEHEVPARTGDPERDRASYLAALAEAVGEADDDGLRDAVIRDLASELERLRTGRERRSAGD